MADSGFMIGSRVVNDSGFDTSTSYNSTSDVLSIRANLLV